MTQWEQRYNNDISERLIHLFVVEIIQAHNVYCHFIISFMYRQCKWCMFSVMVLLTNTRILSYKYTTFILPCSAGTNTISIFVRLISIRQIFLSQGSQRVYICRKTRSRYFECFCSLGVLLYEIRGNWKLKIFRRQWSSNSGSKRPHDWTTIKVKYRNPKSCWITIFTNNQ